MKNPIIYLAGPMDGVTLDQSKRWREQVKESLSSLYEFRDPMVRDLVRENYNRKLHEPIIVEGDKEDIRQSQIILANCWVPSHGTSMEIFLGYCLNKHVVSVVPRQPCSPWVSYHSNQVVESLEEAIWHLTEWRRTHARN